MSDDDHIKSLIVDVIHSMSNDMAIHIEELEAENMGLRLELQHANDAADEAIERAKKLEAKLAKAMEQALDAASAYLKQQYGLGALSHPVDRGRIIAELKGESDE
jgi:regulator of replication initiation timing